MAFLTHDSVESEHDASFQHTLLIASMPTSLWHPALSNTGVLSLHAQHPRRAMVRSICLQHCNASTFKDEPKKQTPTPTPRHLNTHARVPSLVTLIIS
ncbi:hypothetical protein E2C01_036828 [Portunus trituberculatus]|uniref:Uncharacterized protein n=1 Tax=Portunus trituberculatus TaxID=210409 RepID=A0A5B7FDQ4_PORTR|nr:hypothetical protein [Portunus trituberculatus]